MNINWWKIDDWIRKVELANYEAQIKIHLHFILKEKCVLIYASHAKIIIWEKSDQGGKREISGVFLRTAQNLFLDHQLSDGVVSNTWERI